MVVGGDESLFCRIAVEQGFLVQDDVDRVRIEQAKSASRKPLVIHLIDEGLIDDKKLEEILERVEKAATAKKRRGIDRGARPRFGELAIEMGLVDSQSIDEGIRIQKKEATRGRQIRIGQILGERGYLRPDQIQDVLAAQGKRVVRCSGCRAKFNISHFDPGKTYQCRKCGFPLDLDEVVNSVSASRSIVAASMVSVEEIGASLIGRKVGDFEIVEMVGEGGMAEVYKVVDASTQTVRALKVLKGNSEQDRFRREIKNIRRLQHPHIIRIYDDGVFEGKPYFFMDYVDGETLVERMDRTETSLADAIEILRQICEGLAAAHDQKIIHRDIKPSNILLDVDADENLLCKITDFGIARSSTDTQVTMEGELLGTFKYMAPEHIKGLPVDGRGDVFSLGVIAYELLTGQEPFEVDAPVGYLFVNIKEDPAPIHQVNKTLPRKLDALIGRMMAKEPRDRYTSNALASDLAIVQAYIDGTGDLASEDPESAFYVSGGRRILAGVGKFFTGFGRKKPIVHRGPVLIEEESSILLESQECDLSETEALEFSQEAKQEYEWAMDLLAEGNVDRAKQSLRALVELAGPGSIWGFKAAEKLREIEAGKLPLETKTKTRSRKQRRSARAALQTPAPVDLDLDLDPHLDDATDDGEEIAALDEALAQLQRESDVLDVAMPGSGDSDDDDDATIEEPVATSDLGRRLREEDIRTSEMILTDTSDEVSRRAEEIDIQLAQESLISAKTFIDKVQSLAEYNKQRERLEAIFRRISGTRWESEAAEELAEVLYKWGRFLIAHKQIEEGIDKYWLMVERYPYTRWAEMVITVLSEIERPEGMTLVGGGRVLMASSNGREEYVQLAPFFIDEVPVTNAAYKDFVDASGYSAPRHWKNRVYPLGKGNHPVVYISWEDSSAYARWRGKRLPTEEEWAKAAAGEDVAAGWPWGNAFDETLCNTRSLGIGDTTPVGQYPDGQSAVGCLDMIGNVWEWTDSWHDPDSKAHRVLRGGSWFTYGEFSYIGYRNYDSPKSRTRLYGFRCCRNFERDQPAG